ncbi:hypothetical protein [Clostridium sp. C8-1-8]|nr:hypothetical protein [Clostridium sp. C8-1-8]
MNLMDILDKYLGNADLVIFIILSAVLLIVAFKMAYSDDKHI